MKLAFHIFWVSFLISTVFVAPFLKYKKEDALDLETKQNTYAVSVTNAPQSTILQGIQASNVTIAPDYSTRISNHYGDTNTPKFELFVGGEPNPIIDFSTINLSKSREFEIIGKNLSSTVAKNVQLHLYAPINPTNVIAEQWREAGHPENIETMQQSQSFYSWAVDWPSLPGGLICRTPTFKISTNMPIPLITRRMMEQAGYCFFGSLSNIPLDSPFGSGTTLPAILLIQSENSTLQSTLQRYQLILQF